MTPLTALVMIVFGVSLFGLLQTYFIYPAFLYVITSLQNSEGNVSTTQQLPTVTLVIAAYNEEDVIEEKIENSLQLEYPEDKLRIIVFSDESSDRTDEIVRSYRDSGIELRRIEGRVGKTECQNQVAAELESDIIVFSDANSMYEADSIKKLVDGFDSGVGCVVGELRYEDQSDVEGESFYWRYEQVIKKLESKFNSLVTGNGSIYAVRRSSYVPLSRDAISDFAEPLAIVSNGETVKYATGAVAWEQTGDSVESEQSRRTRIVTRCWHTVASFAELLNPVRHPLFSFELVSHKILRWLSPVLLLVVFLSNLALVLTASSMVFTLLFAMQLLFYLCAVIGWAGDRLGFQTMVLFHVPYYFLVSNYGMFVGLANFVKGRNIVTWETADRSVE